MALLADFKHHISGETIGMYNKKKNAYERITMEKENGTS